MKSSQKLGIFHFQSQFQKTKLTSIFLKIVFLPKFTLVEQLLLKSFYILSMLEKFNLVESCLNLNGCQSLAPQGYQKILLECLLLRI